MFASYSSCSSTIRSKVSWGFLYVSVLFVLCMHSVFASDSKTIYLKIDPKDRFEVLYHRAESTVTGAVLFGLIGAGIEEGIRSNKDKEKKAALLKSLSNPSCHEHFISSLKSKLANSGFQSIVLPENNNEFSDSDLVLEVKINICGFKMVDTTAKDVAAFVNFSAVLKQASKKVPFDKNYTFAGKKSYSFDSLLGSSSIPEDEFVKVLNRAGKRLANKVIYRKGE